eukprot:scaffold69268_cov75-Phaeocystis_antarctica.AAC.3
MPKKSNSPARKSSLAASLAALRQQVIEPALRPASKASGMHGYLTVSGALKVELLVDAAAVVDLDPVRPAHAVEDGQSHVGPAQLADDRRVRGLDAGVDDRLRVDDDVDVVIVDAEEPLVHHRRRVDRDLGAHVPVGVGRRLLAHRLGLGLVERHQLLRREVAEGTARRGEDDAAQRVGRHALQALEDGRVLRVGGRHHRAVLLEQRQDDRPARDERLFVGQRDRAAQLDRLDRRQQPGDADDARHHRVGARRHGRRNLAVATSDDLRRFHASGLQPFAQLALLLRRRQADDLVRMRVGVRVRVRVVLGPKTLGSNSAICLARSSTLAPAESEITSK